MAERDWEEDQNLNFPSDWMDKQIERSVVDIASSVIERTLGWSVNRKRPAKVTAVSFVGSRLRLVVSWPFTSPLPTNDPGDYLSTKKDIDRFRQGFTKYLREDRVGWDLTKVLYDALGTSLFRHLDIYRFTGTHLRHGKRLRVPAKLVKGLIARHLAGRREPHITKQEGGEIQRFASEVHQAVSEMREKIVTWQREAHDTEKKLGEDAIKHRLVSEYDTRNHPWMQYFSYCFRKVPVSAKSRTPGRAPSLSDLQGWAASDLVRVIVRETLYVRKGVYYPDNEIRRTISTRKSCR